MNHIAEQTLDKLYLAPDELSEQEKNTIELHLKDCALCREYAENLRAFYHDLQDNLQGEPTERDRTFVEKILAKKRLALPQTGIERRASEALDAVVEIIEPYRRSLPLRVVRYVQRHPVRVASGFSLAAALVVLALSFLRSVKDTNPAYHKVLHQVLYVYNKNGEVLWTKSARGVSDDSSKFNPSSDLNGVQDARVFDIDGDEQNEVLLTGSRRSGTLPDYLKPYDFTGDSLYCFNSDGSLRWKHGMKGGMKFGAIDFSKNPNWQILKFLPLRRSGRERIQLFVIAEIMPSWPTKLMELDPFTGKELQSYWNPGAIGLAVEADIDGDGMEELVCGAINNQFKSASVIVFDPNHVEGAGPTDPEFSLTDVGKGTEKYYLLLPRTQFGEALGSLPYNGIDNLQVSSQRGVDVSTDELIGKDRYSGGIVYGFGDSMKVNYLVANDAFVVSFERARKQGLIHEELNASYYDKLKKSIRYWDGEKFVHEPTMNKRYLEVKNLLQ